MQETRRTKEKPNPREKATLREIRDGWLMFSTEAEALQRRGYCRFDKKQDRYVLTEAGTNALARRSKSTNNPRARSFGPGQLGARTRKGHGDIS